MTRDYFTFYRSYYESLQDLDKEDRLIIYEAIMNYMFNGIEPTLDGIPKIIYGLIRPTLLKSKKLSENGKKGGAPKGNTNAKK